MTLPEKLHEWSAREKVLVRVGWACWGITGLLLFYTVFDPTEILGISRWTKPAKFAASFAIYSWTIALFLVELEASKWVGRIARWGIVGYIALEQLVITLQSARGITSHYNDSTPLDGAIYESMRQGVIFNTLVILVIFSWALRTPAKRGTAWLWGVRFGLLVFIVGGLEGIIMSVRRAHSVGVPDGGPGLPVVNWSTMGGDLRIAHFLGLHALQLLPLAGWILDRLSRDRPGLARSRTLAMVAFMVGYLALLGYLVWSALRGVPLVQIAG